MADRGVSEVISYVLVFALIVGAVGIVSVSGLDTLQDRRNTEQLDNAERAFDVFSDNVADIFRRGAPSRATEINLGESELSTGSNVTMRVNVTEGTNDPQEVVNTSVRPLVYVGDEDREIAYEAGAVFRTNRDGGVVLQDPPFIVNDNNVFIPVVGLNRPGGQTFGGSTVLVRTREQSTQLAYNDTQSNADAVTVTIAGSAPPRESLWRDHLESRGFSCSDTTVAGDDGIECTFDPGSIDRVYIVYYDISVTIDP